MLMEVLVTDKQDNCVRVCSSFGEFFGMWRSPSLPQLKKYTVGLDSHDIISDDMLTFTPTSSPHIECTGNDVYLTGLLEEIENDVLFLRLGTDLVMFETAQNSDYSKYIGLYVQVRVSQLLLYDVGLS